MAIKNNKEETRPQFGNIKDELFLISIIILAAGLVFTDAYYQRFGFKYQMLNFSTAHIIYKGLTMVVTSPLMLFPYLLTISLVLLELYAIKRHWKVFLELRTPIVYFFLIANLMIIYPLAAKAGRLQAEIDMYIETTGLPKIRSFISNNLTIKPPPMDNQIYVLFMIDGDFVTILPLLHKGVKGVYPIIKRINKSDVSLIETTL
jgi:hypothetical protein